MNWIIVAIVLLMTHKEYMASPTPLKLPESLTFITRNHYSFFRNIHSLPYLDIKISKRDKRLDKRTTIAKSTVSRVIRTIQNRR
uniref:Transposase Tc1-like domain-containing protein n=1 Tax=Glossina palpalis gambiensis TaxID=67801 RepID=A0A1B0B6Q5_9MUSC